MKFITILFLLISTTALAQSPQPYKIGASVPGQSVETLGPVKVVDGISHNKVTLTAGTYTNYDVTGISLVRLDNATGAIVVDGLSGGVDGQTLTFIKSNASAGANTSTIKHVTSGRTQNVTIGNGADIVYNGVESGKTTLVYESEANRWVATKDLDFTSGDYTVSGDKTFTGNVIINGAIKTVSGSGTVVSTGTLTLYTAPNDGQNQLYQVTVMYRSGFPARGIALVASSTGVPSNVIMVADGSNMTITLSGQDIVFTNTSGGSSNIVWNVTRLH